MKKEEAKKILNKCKEKENRYMQKIYVSKKKTMKKIYRKNPDFLPLLSGRSTIMVMIFRTMPEIVKIT